MENIKEQKQKAGIGVRHDSVGTIFTGTLLHGCERDINRDEESGCGAWEEIDLGLHLQKLAHPWVAGAGQKQHGFHGR